MPIFSRLGARLATLASYVLDPWGTAQARSADRDPEPRDEPDDRRSGEATGEAQARSGRSG